MKKHKKAIVITVVSLVAATLAFVFLNDNTQENTLVLEQAPLRQVLGSSGKVTPRRLIQVQSQISGVIKEIPVETGNIVEQGSIVTILDDADANNAYQAAELRLMTAKVALSELKTTGNAVAAESLNQAKIALDNQESLLNDYENLYEQDALDQKTLDDAKVLYKTLSSQYNSALSNYRSLQERGATYEAAALLVSQAENDLEAAEQYLKKHQVLSPATGMIRDLEYEPGEFIQPGSILATVATEPNSYVLLNIDETSVNLLTVGQQARVWPESFPEQTTQALVDRIAPSVDEDTGTIEVRLKITGDNSKLLQDMTVRAEIIVRELEESLILPAKYLIRSNPYTVLVKEATATVERIVRLEEVDLSNYLIVEGLVPGDEIVLPEPLQE